MMTMDLSRYLYPLLAEQPQGHAVQGRGLSGGAVAGYVCFSDEDVEDCRTQGRTPLYFQRERTTREVPLIYKSAGYVGLTPMSPGAHPVILSRIKGIPVILNVHEEFAEGEPVTLDALTGRIYRGHFPIQQPKELPAEMLATADLDRAVRVRSLMVLPSDDTPFSRFHAEGIGPFATEYMFFEGEQMQAFQRFIILGDGVARQELKDMQKEAFMRMFKMARGAPVAIRYFDPPLNEFLPKEVAAIDALADRLGMQSAVLERRISEMQEINPALGYRGSRIGIVDPDVYLMQSESIFEAAAAVQKEGVHVDLEIIYPLIALPAEIDCLNRTVLEPVAANYPQVHYKRGIMVELPTAYAYATEIGERVQTVSFGTNDLTQALLGMSRDDAARFLDVYAQRGIIRENPFRSLHPAVTDCIKKFIATAKGVRPDLEIGICGSHASDEASLKTLSETGILGDLTYLSVMPFSVVATKLLAKEGCA